MACQKKLQNGHTPHLNHNVLHSLLAIGVGDALDGALSPEDDGALDIIDKGVQTAEGVAIRVCDVPGLCIRLLVDR